ncbi:ATP-dependent HslUV protease ATP-binding subunit HslU [Granulicatella balaenopterae]|uniref:ATP-dependent protease ATPase subunit HslU n=1 Tax=Granulicatella balaenopterae TaxID=137733 RepID=A0A1H9JYL0_9LACT|nr:ATP-dependent protease ATPase subunit HslU [Granulicatella balaenopterae]SEQ91783.1 ATP-dependent HslUV protease ATP-binding subunit HslU [Granulicatella balaenopterae]
MNELISKTPREVVAELDRFIIGQNSAKRAVAVALRNRYRRLLLDEDMQKEVTPKNLLMIGPTGVGKTELARRLATMVQAPFVKVEATKFTEVGYVGRDVESMVRDLVDSGIRIVEAQKKEAVRGEAYNLAIKKLAAILKPGVMKKVANSQVDYFANMAKMMGLPQDAIEPEMKEEVTEEVKSSRREIEKQLRNGELMNKEVTIEVVEKPIKMGNGGMGMEQMMEIQSMLDSMKPKKKMKRTVTVPEAIEILTQQEADNLVNMDDVYAEALKLAETSGIIFIDEIDKIAAKNQNGGEVSREGVQRDILPIVEGSAVNTKYGVIHTDHILFIASGAFHVAKPSDLMPELQGRFPIRVELEDLTQEDFERILTEPHNALLKQYKALLATENIEVVFTKEAVSKLAEIAFEVNSTTENIGARRLHTILERLLEELLFEAPDMHMGNIQITESYVMSKLGDVQQDEDLSRYIL